jgi:hypothetical protein
MSMYGFGTEDSGLFEDIVSVFDGTDRGEP